MTGALPSCVGKPAIVIETGNHRESSHLFGEDHPKFRTTESVGSMSHLTTTTGCSGATPPVLKTV